jgi:putative PIN family toxin of toxin-antitoxin system
MLEKNVMPGGKLKIIIDTNIWINFLISKSKTGIDRLFENDRIEILFSNELLEEFTEVIQKPGLRKFFSINDTQNLFKMLDFYGRLIKVTSEVTICRDPDDDFLLALAKDGGADFLITSDKDLLIIKKFSGCHIVTYSDFKLAYKI